MDPSDVKPSREDLIETLSMQYDKRLLQMMTDYELQKLLFPRIRLGVWISDLRDEGKTYNDKYRH